MVDKYIRSYKNSGGGHEIIDYYVDTEDHLKELIITDTTSHASTAFIKETGKMAFIIDGKWTVPTWMQ